MQYKKGFTLIELLVVVAIIGILIGLVSPGIKKAKVNAKRTQALVEMKSIETAIKAYFNEYGKLPVPKSAQGSGDYNTELGEQESMFVIQALAAEENTAGGSVNARGITFLEPQSINSAPGSFVDPWGTQYFIALDSDYDGELAVLGRDIRAKQAVVSKGLYLRGGSSNTNDLLTSWH